VEVPGGSSLCGLWADGAAQGWFGLGGEDALDAALAAIRELGRDIQRGLIARGLGLPR